MLPCGEVDWKILLSDLRAHLPPTGQAGLQRGSLRWLEHEMGRRGGNPAALRNIIYRDIGTPADKVVLSGILGDLARELGRTLDLPQIAPPPQLPDEVELLGRSKKRIYKQFLAGVRAGRAPRLVISGRKGSGKTVLLNHIAQALETGGTVGLGAAAVTRLNLTGDLFQQRPAPETLGRSYAALAAQQQQWIRERLPSAGVLLVRVTADLNFGGSPPRLPDGSPVSSAAWAAQLLSLVPAEVPLLLALEDPAGWAADAPAITELRPPTPSEARAYLIQKLGVTRQVAEQLLRETGRNLDRLTLLAGAGGSAGQMLSDPEVLRLAAAMAALGRTGVEAPHPGAALEVVLGQTLTTLPLHARAQLLGEAGAGWTANATLARLLPAVPPAEVHSALQRLAVASAVERPLVPYHLAALVELREWGKLTRHLERAVDDNRFLPDLWPRIRAAAPPLERETLAREVVNHHAGRGEYDAPMARDALFCLLESGRDPVRAWARVKLAESSLDNGNFAASEEQLRHHEVQHILHLGGGADAWSLAAQADALLVQAALARWQGNMELATRAASDPRIVQSGPRVQLWRGLIAKDAGHWPEAMTHLQAVPDTSPLLAARARYQEGDLRLRLGQPQAALSALLDAAMRLEEAGGTAEERARILARAATAQRRLGHPGRALDLSREAMDLIPPGDRRQDAVLRARLLSERLPILLALGQPDAALPVAAQALALLQGGGPRRAEAEYRARRTHYRVALAYLTRGLGLPYQQPLSGPAADNADLRFARQQLDELLTRPPDQTDREQVLTFDMRLSRALAEPGPERALEHASRALDMTDHPYAEAQARAIRADALARAGKSDAALAEINRAHSLLRRVQVGLPGTHAADPALHAHLLALEARLHLHEGLTNLLWLRSALSEDALQPFRAGVWREVGLSLEGQPEAARLLQELHSHAQWLPMRLRDALPLLEAPAEP